MILELDGDACSNTGVAIEAAVGNIMTCDLHIESGRGFLICATACHNKPE